jgi:serine/threonine-protein kinase
MSQSRHVRVKSLFLEACDLPAAEQQAFLQQACEGDDELRAELESLLDHHRVITSISDSQGSTSSLVTRPATVEPDAETRIVALLSGDAARQLTPGEVLGGRYRFIGEIGRGGMGAVLRAHDLVLGQPVALKLLVDSSPARLAQLINETRLALRVTHTNVCRVYDVGEVDGEPFISMEWVDGEDLHSLLKRIGRLPGDKVLEIARQLCAGLTAAHAKGVLHRDLKPSNVLIDSNGQIKISDFGIAVTSDQAIAELTPCGTPAYMAPELLAGGEASVQSDLYALGALLYELATGNLPFADWRNRVSDGDSAEVAPELPSALVSDLDPSLEWMILSCLEADPARRPATALAVAAALPGADPLRLALDAGITPSPEQIADTGSEPRLSPLAKICCLAGCLLLLVAVVLLADHANGFAKTDLEMAPAALAYRAGEILDRLGYQVTAADRACGFLQDLHAAELGLTERSVLFWYRQHDQQMLPVDITGFLYGDASVGPHDPPLIEEGQVRILLDSAGRLVMFEVIPERWREQQESAATTDWSQILELAGLDLTMLAETEPQLLPPVFADAVAGWEGEAPGSPGAAIRIDAAALNGRPVYFDLYLSGELEPGPDDGPPAVIQRFNFLANVDDLVFVLLALVAVPLARRNLVKGRGDPQGARRLATVVTTVLILATTLQAHHVPQLSAEITVLSAALAAALLHGGLVWICYLALEPYVRRLWPHSLIAWSRLLGGRWRDPLVHQSLLLGALFGSLWTVMSMLDEIAPALLDNSLPPFPVDSVQLATAMSFRATLSNLLSLVAESTYEGLFSLLLLVVLRVALRHPWPAVTLYLLVTGTVATLYASHMGTAWLTIGLGVAFTGAYALIRFGLLTLIAGLLVNAVLLSFPVTTDLNAWYAGAGLFAMAVVATLAAVGFWRTMAGQTLIPEP